MLESLRDEVREAVRPLFERLPLERAMTRLTPSEPMDATILTVASETAERLASDPPLVAAVWLYVDDLERSHRVSQGIEGPTGAAWHAIMHRREGDFWNSKYWWRRVGPHPGIEGNPAALVDAVEAARGTDDPELVRRQREEWARLFAWCAGGAS
ncbi:MAG: hypothetical protein KIS66_12765 [Fimbriimonadaceae bacterium]|nr:hypothetical protein [Fimbriimonadaceae bacterium]